MVDFVYLFGQENEKEWVKDDRRELWIGHEAVTLLRENVLEYEVVWFTGDHWWEKSF